MDREEPGCSHFGVVVGVGDPGSKSPLSPDAHSVIFDLVTIS